MTELPLTDYLLIPDRIFSVISVGSEQTVWWIQGSESNEPLVEGMAFIFFSLVNVTEY